MLKSEGEDLKSIYLKKKLTAAAALIHRFILFSCFCLLLENVPKPATTFHQIAHLIFVGLYLSQWIMKSNLFFYIILDFVRNSTK